MKTSKEQRDDFLKEAVPFFEKHSQYWKRSMVQYMRDDISTLETRLSWAEAMLERARSVALLSDSPLAAFWLADYKRGPSDV